MIRTLVAATIASAALVSAAHAQPADADERRFQFNEVADGSLRLDLKTGEVSLCARRSSGWSCLAVPDDRTALDAEIARLQGENANLKKTLLDHGLPLPGGVVALPPPAVEGGELKLPSDADINRAMAVVEKMWRRLVDAVQGLGRDLKGKD
jgi:hypothetical protein